MDTFTLVSQWWAGPALLSLGLTASWVGLLFLARRFAPSELPRLALTLGLLCLHIGVGFWAANHADVAADPHHLAWLSLQLLTVAVAVSLFNHLVLGIALGRFQRSVPTLLRDVLSLVALLVAAIILLARHGFDVKALLPTGAVLTAVVGLALQQTLGNVVGGLSLQLDKSVRVDDWISVDGHYGRVSAIRWRYTAIETNDFDTVIVPNAQLLAAKLLVRGRRNAQSAPWRRWIRFRLPYDAPSAEVIALVEQAIKAEPLTNVALTPEPNALLESLEDGVAHYALRYWLTRFDQDDRTDSAVRLRLLYTLRRAGFDPALPAQQVTLLETGREARADSDQKAQSEREAALAAMEIFSQLTPAERSQLARDLKPLPFGPNETLCRQGDAADSLYIVHRGRVRVRVAADGGEREVAQLGTGSYFGEMGLMTGEPRSATVLADGHVTAFRLEKEPFRQLLAQRPELAESIAELLAQRKVELEAAREQLDKPGSLQRHGEHRRQLLGRIRKFFGNHA